MAVVPRLTPWCSSSCNSWIKVLRGDTCYSRAYKRVVSGLRHFIGMEDAPESKAAV